MKLGELNELAYEDVSLSVNTSFSVGKMAFGFVRNAKSADFPEGYCKIELNRLVSKDAPHTASSLLKLKSEFCNSKSESIKKDQDDGISTLKVLRIQMNEFSLKVRLQMRILWSTSSIIFPRNMV